MKFKLSVLLLWFISFNIFAQTESENLIIITIDGVRWKEVFEGADSSLLFNDQFKKTEFRRLTRRYWDENQEKRREKLMPFLWSELVSQGRLYGNLNYDNKVAVRNEVNVSYPGYAEIFTGYADPEIKTNEMIINENISLFAFLNQQDKFKGKVASFASWDRILGYLNHQDNDFVINGGYNDLDLDNLNTLQRTLNNLQSLYHKGESSRPDYITYLQAKEYLRINRPKALSIGFAWTDDMAHDGSYPLYLDKIFTFDNMIQDLWEYVQAIPQYKNKTTLLITVDHGRGYGDKWVSHSKSIPESEETWFLIISPGLSPLGEMKTNGQYYHDQYAQTLANLLGYQFMANHPIAPAIKEIVE